MDLTAIVWYLMAAIGALGWVMAYVLIIRRNHLEKTYGIPLAALGVNLAWELNSSLRIFQPVLDEKTIAWIGISIVWFLLDIVLLIQTIVYGTRENWPSKFFFYGATAASLLFGFAGVLAMAAQFQDSEGQWSAFANNLLMSILFITMLYQRGIRGQSIYIGLGKLVGTLVTGIPYLIRYPTSPLQWYLTITILFFDIVYMVVLYRKIRAANLNPWARF